MTKLSRFLLILCSLIFPLITFAQGPALPVTPSCPTASSAPIVGSGAPVGDSILLLIGLALLYAVYKYTQLEKTKELQYNNGL